MERRSFLKLALGSAVLPFAGRQAAALDYPNRPVHMLVGQAAGSSSDISARLIGQYLYEHLGQQFVIEIRPGATGNVATEAAVHATPDGYTILLVNSQNTINQALIPTLPFNFVKDIAPIAITHRVAMIMEVHPSFPAKTVPEFIAYAKANPGKINMASAGVGGPQHMAGELFKFMAGVDLVHVPYHGTTPALTDLLAGNVQVMFDVTPSSLAHIKSGALRALAVTTPDRLDFLPGVPAVAEFLPGYKSFGWIGFGAPAGTPPAIISVLNKGINDAVADPAIKGRLLDLGGLIMPPNTPEEFAKFIATDTAGWSKVVKFANLKPE
ncbi:MAG TPA: tripartite tricarboxylate transporter substrate binding protein [Xanthobacteraceae bacterium]|nr:tripartite tricarboxylate transporter substrate binding protein [Xanthobacteraceae bacterium]